MRNLNMIDNTDIAVLDRLLVVNLDVHIWSARKKLLPYDLGNADLPPEELASLGSKRVCNPEDLKTFGTLKARATSLLERAGIRFIGGWAIPEEKLDEITSGLATIRDEFNVVKDNFLKGYNSSVQEWINRHPGWEEIIANSVVSEDYVRSRLDFRWQTFRIVPPATGGEPIADDNLTEDIQNLGCALYDEISRFATETWRKCYEGKTEVTRKALSPLKTMYDKLMGLTFIEPRVSPIASLIRTALESIPQRGPIAGATLLMLQGLISLLRMPQDIVAHGQKILEGKKPEDVLAVLVGPAAHSPIAEPTRKEIDDFPEMAQNPQPPVLANCGLW